jgi:hypothetical protein
MAHFFPILVVIIVVISKIIAAAGKQSGAGPSQPTSPRRPPVDSEEERMRRFMEAVGLPPGSTPPPPVQPRTIEEPAPLLPVRPPTLYPNVPGRLKRVPPAIPPVVRPARGQTSRIFPPSPSSMPPAMSPLEPAHVPVAMAAIDPFPQSAGPAIGAVSVAAPAQITYPAKSLLLRLRNPTAVREAIILREVLGPPKAFQAGLVDRGGIGVLNI